MTINTILNFGRNFAYTSVAMPARALYAAANTTDGWEKLSRLTLNTNEVLKEFGIGLSTYSDVKEGADSLKNLIAYSKWFGGTVQFIEALKQFAKERSFAASYDLASKTFLMTAGYSEAIYRATKDLGVESERFSMISSSIGQLRFMGQLANKPLHEKFMFAHYSLETVKGLVSLAATLVYFARCALVRCTSGSKGENISKPSNYMTQDKFVKLLTSSGKACFIRNNPEDWTVPMKIYGLCIALLSVYSLALKDPVFKQLSFIPKKSLYAAALDA